ncbi:hypothetical protein CKAH01_05254 [Colletotrichum kahawae]|uniref:Uncharacterized protein n=1 Tax=Colletotrichum kahawae TaxID=34407 RepID=A0AAD9YF90_COLKA|nr:hypothetical protein CKAH01_05254 [Colletotrichum kahawae]
MPARVVTGSPITCPPPSLSTTHITPRPRSPKMPSYVPYLKSNRAPAPPTKITALRQLSQPSSIPQLSHSHTHTHTHPRFP